ncbi:hypothetical protein DRW03_00010 [Corallococcus sp. H22C18031201]|nr:hypothetical protein DRW03_00010 [Corallococcus sp. H22C18031201]
MRVDVSAPGTDTSAPPVSRPHDASRHLTFFLIPAPNHSWNPNPFTWGQRTGVAPVFIAIDHGSAECVGIHAGYNEHWMLERHNFLSPNQARRKLMQSKQAA